MPGTLLHVGAAVACAHGGQAQPGVPNPRVMVCGSATVAVTSPFKITGCTLPPQAGGPCATAQFVTAALRITSNGQPLLLLDSQAKCVPTTTPLFITATQLRVTGM